MSSESSSLMAAMLGRCRSMITTWISDIRRAFRLIYLTQMDCFLFILLLGNGVSSLKTIWFLSLAKLFGALPARAADVWMFEEKYSTMAGMNFEEYLQKFSVSYTAGKCEQIHLVFGSKGVKLILGAYWTHSEYKHSHLISLLYSIPALFHFMKSFQSVFW